LANNVKFFTKIHKQSAFKVVRTLLFG